MVATAYLFLLAISVVSGTFFPTDQNGSPLEIPPKLSYQGTFQFPYRTFDMSEFRLDDCMRRHSYFQIYKCYQYLSSIKEDLIPKLESDALKANTRTLTPKILNENDKHKPESYINSILDEDKRDGSNFNASDSALNSVIEIKDPRKTTTTLNDEIAPAEEMDEFVSFTEKNIANGEEANPSIAEGKGNGTNDTASDGSNTEAETTRGIQQQTITITGTTDAITRGKIEEGTTITGETSDVTLTKGVTEGKTTAKQDLFSTVEIDEENKGNTHVQKKTTGVSSSETVEKSTTADLSKDSDKVGFKVTTENTTTNETDFEVTTEKGNEDKSSSTEHNLSTESRSTLTSMEPENLNNDTTSSTLFTDPTKSESVSVSDADISPSSETESSTISSTAIFPSISVTESTGYATKSSDGGFTSTMITDSESSTGDYVTKSRPIVPEHVINIRSIKTAKIVLSVLLLVTGLIAVVMLAIYLFRVRRGAVQYDQLTLLP